MSAMSKTAALRAAQSACGKPIGGGTSWVCYVPYYDDQPSGPSTELRADSYSKMVQRRADKVASVALALMGVCETEDQRIDAECAMDRAKNWSSVPAKDLLDAALKAIQP